MEEGGTQGDRLGREEGGDHQEHHVKLQGAIKHLFILPFIHLSDVSIYSFVHLFLIACTLLVSKASVD